MGPLTREERRSIQLHEAIARKLEADPGGVLQRARQNLVRMRAVNPHAGPLLARWEELLAGPLAAVLATLRDPGSEARELRHVTPFAGVLTTLERTAVYSAFGAEDGSR